MNGEPAMKRRTEWIRQILRHIVRHYSHGQWVDNQWFYNIVMEKLDGFNTYHKSPKFITYREVTVLTRELRLPKRYIDKKNGRLKHVEYQLVKHGAVDHL